MAVKWCMRYQQLAHTLAFSFDPFFLPTAATAGGVGLGYGVVPRVHLPFPGLAADASFFSPV